MHWQPIQYRVNLKVITLVFKCIHGLAPSYLEEFITIKKPSQQGLRSEQVIRQPEVPRTTRHTFAARLLRVRGPTL